MSNRRSYGAVRRLPSGYFQASIPNPELPGSRLNAPMTFTSRGDADTWIAKQKVLMSEGRWSATAAEGLSFPRFKDFANQHLRVQTSKRGGLLRASTRQMQEDLLERHLTIFLELRINEVTRGRVDEWYADLIMTGKRTTASRCYSLLSAIMTRAVNQGLVRSNPCQIDGARTASSEKLVEIPSDSQLEAILESLPIRWRLQVLFLAFTALRFGEMAALHVGDLVWDGEDVKAVKVSKAASCLRGGVVIDKPKTKMSKRLVPVAPLLREPLKALASKTVEGNLLFPATSGGVQRVDTFSKIFARAIIEAGLGGKGLNLHGLRHYGGTKFGETGASLAEIKNFLGDSSTKAAERYLHGSSSSRGLIERVQGVGIESIGG